MRDRLNEREIKSVAVLWGGWRQDVRKLVGVKSGYPGGGNEGRRGVRARIVAMKRRNGRGAKAGRETDGHGKTAGNKISGSGGKA